MDEDLITIGRIVKVQGNKGEVRISPCTDFPERFKELEKATLILSDGEKIVLTLKYTRYYKSRIILKFNEIHSIAEAEKLLKARLVVSRNGLIPLVKDEYYHFDLMDMEVFTEKGH